MTQSIRVMKIKQSTKEGARRQCAPRLCFVGPMVGLNGGRVTTQGQILSEMFGSTGQSVIAVSSKLKRHQRLVDVIGTLVRNGRRIDIQIIEAYSGPSFLVADIASWLGRRFNHRVVLWMHGGALPDFIEKYPRWARRVFGRADAIIAPSRFLERALTKHGFQVQVIPNVIDLPAYTYRHRAKVTARLFWMRQFHPIWNPMMALRALARLRTSVPDATLVMAGQDKGQEIDVRQTAKELGVADAVRFSGFLDMQGKIREGDSADIFISTNRIDNAPVAVVEACAMGLPVISTRVGGIPDLLTDGETALLVPDNDDEAMCQAIELLVNRAGLSAQLSANGRQLAERFSWQQVRPQWEQAFDKLMRAS
jgi:glycosyltransferase involved in cell wall biosynthesis